VTKPLEHSWRVLDRELALVEKSGGGA
jgi:hypothetical protein